MKRKAIYTLLLIASFGSGYSQSVDLFKGLIQYFPLDNSTSDLSKNALPTEVTGTLVPAKGYQGVDNTSYDFNQGSIHIADTLQVPIPFTISYWMYVTPLTSGWESFYNTPNRSVELGISGYSTISPRCSLYVNNNFDVRFDDFNSVISTNQWTHLMYEMRTDSILLFMNGSLASKQYNYQKITSSMQFVDAELGSFGGRIDEFRIYDRILNEREKKLLADPNATITGDEKATFSSNQVSIYPNPSSHLLHINVENSAECSISILNTVGNVVLETIYSSKNGSTPLPIDISSFEKGIYYVKISAANKHLVQKVVVE